MSASVGVGLVGAGPWASFFHAPMLAAGPETTLTGVWARRPDAAEELAARHGTAACATFEDLLDRSEAVAFAVPPTVQAELALVAVAAGKSVLLEKPIAPDIASAARLVDVVEEAGIGSLVVFTARYAGPVREFLSSVGAMQPVGARVWWLSGAFLDGPFASSPWRLQGGALFDVGPHALDLVTAALGPVDRVVARSSPGGWTSILLEHQSGAVSDVSLCCHATGAGGPGIEVVGATDSRVLDVLGAMLSGDPISALRAEFAQVTRTGEAHPCDARRGFEIQKLLAAVASSVAEAR